MLSLGGASQGAFPEEVIGAGQGWRGPPQMVGGRPFLPGHGLTASDPGTF